MMNAGSGYPVHSSGHRMLCSNSNASGFPPPSMPYARKKRAGGRRGQWREDKGFSSDLCSSACRRHRAKIAQRFNAGSMCRNHWSPVGTVETVVCVHFSRPSGTCHSVRSLRMNSWAIFIRSLRDEETGWEVYLHAIGPYARPRVFSVHKACSVAGNLKHSS